MEGWISLHRKIFENPIFKRSRVYSNMEAWLWLLVKANHKDNKFLLGNKMVKVEKGQMITSQKKLCKEFKWGNSKLRSFLKLLQSEDMIELKVDSKSTLITISNYRKLQEKQTANKLKVNRKRTATKSKVNTNNNDNNYNNDNNDNKKDNLYEMIFINNNIEKYGRTLLNAFFVYWSEKGMNGKKMRYEMEKVFNVNSRLVTWAKNDYDGYYKAHLEDQRIKSENKKNIEEQKKIDDEADPKGFAEYIKSDESLNKLYKGKGFKA
tara:strand:+ start:1521 stop:2315 length:795 start_codon:yes stop_codon:yes gene_type:complete